MNSAAFLLAINVTIGLSFAGAFLALTRRSRVYLGRWCAVGFLLAAATVTIEAFSAVIPSVRLTSTLSFGTLMLALTIITIGLAKHYRPGGSVAYLVGLFGFSVALNALVVFDLPRGSWGQVLGYQTPFATVVAIASLIVITSSRHRAADLVLAAVLALTSLQFMGKAILAGLADGDPGGIRDYIVSAYAFYSQTGASIFSLLTGLALVGVVVTEVMEETRLRLQRDALSGLFNRAAFMEWSAREMKRSTATSSVLIICDLDRFKSINDRFGHAAGDEIIRTFGANLRAYFGEDTLCGRLGGEEFCIFLPDCDAAGARAHLEAIRSFTRQSRYALVPADVAVTASFGVAVTDQHEQLDAALHRADISLYEAKAAGRDCYRFAPQPSAA
jgi:diguanylate cyclase (GGDEF)-like protein